MKVLKIFKSLLYRILILVLIGPLGACSEECGLLRFMGRAFVGQESRGFCIEP